MAEYNKDKIYFLKIRKDFFQSHEMRVLEGMDGGERYELLYLKLMLESASHNGFLRFSEQLAYTPKMIASLTNTDLDTVMVAMKALEGLGLVTTTDEGSIFIPKVPELTGITTEGAEKKQEQLARRNKGGTKVENLPPDIRYKIQDSRYQIKESINQYEPVKSPDELLSMMVENGFITESESLDPCWGKFLKDFTHDRQDELGEAEGYIDAKVKLRHVLKSVSTYKAVGEDRNGKPIFAYRADDSLKSIGAKFPWFIKAMRKAVEQMDASEKVRVDWQEALSESQSQDDDEAF